MLGSNFKKFLIEELDGEKIVSRRRGFTVQTCTSTVLQADETPQYNALPMGERVGEGSNGTCAVSVGSELKPACESSCLGACTQTLRKYNEEAFLRTGFELDERAVGKVLRACSRQCTYECGKPGRGMSFSVPSKSLF